MSLPTVLPAAQCRYDAVALGEVMLRLDPGSTRIRAARSFDVWEGGGEYNVARALSRTFGHRTAVLSALVDNEVGRLLESLIMSGGVDPSWIRWRDFDGTGTAARNALNFTERGFGVRGALGVSDRGHSAASQLAPGDFDLEELFGRRGVRWLHTGGIFAGLSASASACAGGAMERARAAGAVVSVDLNFRPSLFRGDGGAERARAAFHGLAAGADVLIGGFQDFADRLGVHAPDAAAPEAERFAAVAELLMERYPRLRVVASTVRRATSASVNDWGARAYARGGEYAESRVFRDLAIFDRVGGGDGFVAGFAHAVLDGGDLQTALEYGAAHGALAMTTPGDGSMASLAEVRNLAADAGHGESR
ncbi:MAG: sugar kinase [Arthrobacter sp.]|uniref:sugar kinase n=1 Tax=Arthrobacter sp. TaxID=1667 RepID=UPI0034841AA8